MKKNILVMALFTMVGIAHADKVFVDDIVVPQGGDAVIAIGYEFNSGISYKGFQLEFTLPDGINSQKDEDGLPIAVAGSALDDHGITAKVLASGVERYIVTSFNNKLLKGTEGTLFSITLHADESTEIGSSFEVTINEILFTTADVTNAPFSDATFSITIGEPDDGRIKFYEDRDALPTYTAGEKGDVTMFRTIKAGNWSTIVLPFTLTKAKAEAAFGSDVELAEFSGFETEYTDEDDMTPNAITINFTTYTMTPKKGITGGKPFLIKTSKDIESFEADDVTLFREVADVAKTDEYDTGGKFTGSLVMTKIPADGLFVNSNKFWYSDGTTNIKAFRCWFELDAVINKETDFGSRIKLHIDDEQTGIVDVQHSTDDFLHYYDLQGRSVNRVVKGLYIKKGKKVMVK